MAALSVQDRARIWRGLMRRWSRDGTVCAFQKYDLYNPTANTGAVANVDDWVDTHSGNTTPDTVGLNGALAVAMPAPLMLYAASETTGVPNASPLVILEGKTTKMALAVPNVSPLVIPDGDTTGLRLGVPNVSSLVIPDGDTTKLRLGVPKASPLAIPDGVRLTWTLAVPNASSLGIPPV